MAKSQDDIDEENLLKRAKGVAEAKLHGEPIPPPKITRPFHVARVNCPVTKEKFLRCAKSMFLTVGNKTFEVKPKVFSKGSFGFHTNGKCRMMIGDTEVKFQVQILVTAVGSKPEANLK